MNVEGFELLASYFEITCSISDVQKMLNFSDKFKTQDGVLFCNRSFMCLVALLACIYY